MDRVCRRHRLHRQTLHHPGRSLHSHRAEHQNGSAYTDVSVTPGSLYYYVVTAANPAGISPVSWETGLSAGLPKPWVQQDTGAVNVQGSTEFDGHTFTLDGAGAGFGGTEDQFQFARQPMNGDGTIIARFVPQMSAMLSSLGLMMRESTAPDSPQVSLLITPQNRRNAESAGYLAQLQTRASAGAGTVIAAESPAFGQPYSDQGRMLGYCWLRLTRHGNIFTASYSPDGKDWTQLPETSLSLSPNLLVGLAVSSTNPRITTTVKFDNVNVTVKKMKLPILILGLMAAAGMRQDDPVPVTAIQYESPCES